MSLRSWLRKNPQPEKLRYTTEDGEERDLQLSADTRGRWSGAEATLLAARAVSVQCLNGKGALIRAMPLAYEDDPDGTPVDADERAERRDEKRTGRNMKELAEVIDRYGHRLTDAFTAGADAASASQDKLVGLVETLTSHLSAAITNLHGLSLQYSHALQKLGATGGDEPSAADGMMAQVMGSAIAKFMGSGGVIPTPPASNGKTGGK
jgi:hypothetical protein